MDADGEICSLQNFGSANAAKEYAQCRLVSCVTDERDSRRIILVTTAIFERQDCTPHLNPLPATEAMRTSASTLGSLRSSRAARLSLGKGRGLR